MFFLYRRRGKKLTLNGRYNLMVTRIFSSLPGKENFTIIKADVSSNSHTISPTTNVCFLLHSTRKTQNYSQFRCATYQRVNNFFSSSFIFIKKQTNLLAAHPARFYIKQRKDMNQESNMQEYSRYRDAQHQTSVKVIKSNRIHTIIYGNLFRILYFMINIYIYLVIYK